MSALYFDDLSVGQSFVSGTAVLDEAALKAFAAQYDPQPFHLDDAAARGTLFGGLAASGWHTAALTMRLMVDSSMSIAGGLIGLGGDISWPRPTRPGDVLQVTVEILELTPSRSKPDRGTARIRITTRNQNGEPVQLASITIMVPRRTGAR